MAKAVRRVAACSRMRHLVLPAQVRSRSGTTNCQSVEPLIISGFAGPHRPETAGRQPLSRGRPAATGWSGSVFICGRI